MLFNTYIPRDVTIMAIKNLANVDYTIATRVSDDVARTVDWSYQHDLGYLANISVNILQYFDNLGSILIAIVVWMVHNTI